MVRTSGDGDRRSSHRSAVTWAAVGRAPSCRRSAAVPGSRAKVSLPLEFSVIDNGPGVPDDLIPYLFDPFVTSKTNGSGLGLALVAKIIGDHGGVIECDSQPGRTAFRILMPAHQEDGRLERSGAP